MPLKKPLSFFSGFIREKLDVKFAVKTGLAAGVALFLGVFISKLLNLGTFNVLVSGLWTSVSAVIISQVHLGSSYRMAARRLIGTALGALMGSLFSTFLGAPSLMPLMLGISVFFTILICQWLNLKASLSLACSTLSVVMILWSLNKGNTPWEFAFFRVFDACVGALVAVTISYLVWPERAVKKVQMNMASASASIRKIYHLMMTQQEEENTRVLIKDTEEIFLKNHLFLDDAKLELFMTLQKVDQWEHLHSHFYKLLDITLSLEKIDKSITAAHLTSLNSFSLKVEDLFSLLEKALVQKDPSLLPHISLQVDTLEEELGKIKQAFFEKKPFSEADAHFFVLLQTQKILVEELSACGKVIHTLSQK